MHPQLQTILNVVQSCKYIKMKLVAFLSKMPPIFSQRSCSSWASGLPPQACRVKTCENDHGYSSSEISASKPHQHAPICNDAANRCMFRKHTINHNHMNHMRLALLKRRMMGATVGKIRPPLIPIVSGPRRATVGMHWLSFQMFNRILKRCSAQTSSAHLPIYHCIMNWLDQVCQTCQGHTAQRGSSLAAQSEFSGSNWSNKESSDPKTASEQPALDLEDRSLASPKPSTTSSNGVSLGQKQDWYIFAEFSHVSWQNTTHNTSTTLGLRASHHPRLRKTHHVGPLPHHYLRAK